MKTKSLLSVGVGAVLGLAAATAMAQTTPGSMLINPTVDLSSGAQNGHVGSAGGVFLTSGTLWPYVNWLGYYDQGGDGLANSHEISLWYVGGTGGSTATEVAHATVPAGTAAPLINGYRWVQIPQVGLWYSSWYTIAAQTDGVDTWGDLISGGQVGWNTDYIGDNDGSWSRAGRYDSTSSWPNSPANQVGSDAIYPVANMAFGLTVVPEPAAGAMLGLGLALWAGRARKRKV